MTSPREHQPMSSLPEALAEVERLRRAERRKDDFLGQLAHEVGNVLVPLPLALEILRQPGLDQNTISRVRDILQEQAVYIQRLISQIRNVSRLTRGIELDCQAVELKSSVERAVTRVRAALEEHRHELAVSLPDEPVLFSADGDRLEQALAHLLQNAIENTGPGGRIQLDAARHNEELSIRVTDNGTGIPADLLPDIFEPFVRRDGLIDWSASRLGIGLSVARQYVELHGGSVTGESAGPDQGSTFTIRLPLNRPAREIGNSESDDP